MQRDRGQENKNARGKRQVRVEEEEEGNDGINGKDVIDGQVGKNKSNNNV